MQSNIGTENDDFLIGTSDGDNGQASPKLMHEMIMDSLGIEKPGTDLCRNISNVSDITLKADDTEEDGEDYLEAEIVMDSVNRINPTREMV